MIFPILMTAAMFSPDPVGPGGAVERAENVVLYCVSEQEGRPTLEFDGYRRAPVAPNVVVSDATGAGVDSVEKLASALGTPPPLDALELGDVAGESLGDAIFATVTLTDGVVTGVETTSRDPRPLVGVSVVTQGKVTPAQQMIANALLRVGARAYFIPNVSQEEELDALLEKLDGFVMPGGVNANPRLFGEVPYPHGSVLIDDVRDVNDVLITRWLIARNVPGLWICRGVQFLNVALGGGLVQDVPTYLATLTLKGEFSYHDAEPIPDDGAPGLTANDPIMRCIPAHYRVRIHGVNHRSGRHALGSAEKPAIDANSKFLLPIVGQNFVDSVMTSHHMAVDPERIGRGLTIVAHAPDGIIEALEYQANDFALGVQFHPDFDTKSENPEYARFGYSFFKALRSASADALRARSAKK